MTAEPWIEIEANGPYVVHGEIRLSEMAPVHTFNGEPVDWHTLRVIPAQSTDGVVRLCRCGQSADRPYCDGKCEAGFDGNETADRTSFTDHARVFEHGAERLEDDTALCVHAGFCGTRTRNAWRIFRHNDDPAERALMREMVLRCPSGRIVLFADGQSTEPTLEPEIAVLPGGPLWLRGAVRLVAADGHHWEQRQRMTLCRCGASGNKPFCDGTHAEQNFDER